MFSLQQFDPRAPNRVPNEMYLEQQAIYRVFDSTNLLIIQRRIEHDVVKTLALRGITDTRVVMPSVDTIAKQGRAHLANFGGLFHTTLIAKYPEIMQIDEAFLTQALTDEVVRRFVEFIADKQTLHAQAVADMTGPIKVEQMPESASRGNLRGNDVFNLRPW